MAVIGLGVDLVVCERIARIWRDHGERFLTRVYTPAERAYCLNCKSPAARLAGRFAAKEAILKALGTGWRGGIGWTDMEVLPDGLGRPEVRLTGGCAAEAARLGIARVVVSISHAGEYAVATAIAT